MSDGFDWQSDDVVIPTQPAIAVFENSNGAVCIRQEGQYGPEDDTWVYFTKDRAVTVAKAILEVAGIDPAALVPGTLTALPALNSNSNAERQRRFRERQRKAVTHVAADHPQQTSPEGVNLTGTLC